MQMKKTPKWLKIFVGISFGLLFLVILISKCSDDGEKTTKESDPEELLHQWYEKNADRIREQEEKYKEDSTSLHAFIFKQQPLFKTEKNVKIEIQDLDEANCDIRILIAESRGEEAQDIGEAACVLAARWFSESEYELAMVKIKCEVRTLTIGVTGRSGFPYCWGTAKYYYMSDSVIWEEGE